MNTITYCGEYFCAESRFDKREQAVLLMDKIKPVIEQQLRLRGGDKMFYFKSHGIRWCYRPNEGD